MLLKCFTPQEIYLEEIKNIYQNFKALMIILVHNILPKILLKITYLINKHTQETPHKDRIYPMIEISYKVHNQEDKKYFIQMLILLVYNISFKYIY